MADDPALQVPSGPSPHGIRLELHRVIEQMTDAEVRTLWRLICSWVLNTSPPTLGDPYA